MIADFIETVRQHIEAGNHLVAIATVAGAVLLAVAAFLALALGLMLSWDAFLTGTFAVPALSLRGACGAVGLLGYFLAVVAAIRDWGDETGE